MTVVTPTYQKPNPPRLPTVLDAVMRELMKKMSCAKVGVIRSFDPGDATHAATATVEIAQQQVTSVSPDGVRTIQEYPLLLNVPVYFPGGGGFSLTFPVADGDECLVIFNDRELDNWLATGPGKAPTTGRMHDLSDGIAFVGLHSNPRALAGISTTATQLRSDDGMTYVQVSPGVVRLCADEVELHGRNKITLDAGGTGFVYTPAFIDTYTDGVAGDHHDPHPPEVPT